MDEKIEAGHSDYDKKFSRDSYLSPTFFSHAENCSLGALAGKSPLHSLTLS